MVQGKFTDEERREVENMIGAAVGTAMEKEEVAEDELPKIGGFILRRLKKVQTNEDMLNFLTELSTRWQFLTGVKTMMQATMQEGADKAAAEKIGILTKQGKLDEALSLAKNLTKNTVQPT